MHRQPTSGSNRLPVGLNAYCEDFANLVPRNGRPRSKPCYSYPLTHLKYTTSQATRVFLSTKSKKTEFYLEQRKHIVSSIRMNFDFKFGKFRESSSGLRSP